ncbi:MAG: hypothetical protein FJ267_01845, partial [Planctomycetes bacterium]|nr:hypothetical protein [Planctomycetota bacterium]
MKDGRRLSVLAKPKEQIIVSALIEQIEAAVSPSSPRHLKVYPVTDEQKARFQTLLPELQSELSTVKIIATTIPREIAIWATDEQHKSLADVLDGLKVSTDEKNVSLNRFPIQVAAPSQLLSMLKTKFPTLQILLNEQQNAVLVWEAANRLDEFKTELEKLTAVLPTVDLRQLETYAVPESEASAILAATKSLVSTAQSSLDVSNRRLIVVGTAKEHQQIRELVEKLSPDGTSSTKVLIAYPLKQTDPAVVVKMLQEMRPDIRFGADVRASRVLVTAPLREQPRLQAIIEQLDAAPESSQEEVVKPYQLKSLSPANVTALIQPLVPELKLVVDSTSKQLYATGTERRHQKLEEILRRIDGNEATRGEIQSYDVGTADPDQVRLVLLQLVPNAVISANASMKRLLVWAPPPEQESIKQAIEQFTQSSPNQTRHLKSYPLPDRVGANIVTLVQAIAPLSSVSLDTSGKQLICWATVLQHQDIQAALDEIGKSQPDRLHVSLQLHEASTDVLQSAVPLLEDVAPRARRVASGQPGKWIVWGTAEEHVAITELLKNLSEQFQNRKLSRVIKQYSLGITDPAVARRVLTSQVTGAVLFETHDPHRLLVQASEEEHVVVMSILNHLRDVSFLPADKTLKTHPIRPDVASQVKKYVATAMLGLEVIESSQSDQFVCWATSHDHERVDELINQYQKELQQPSPRKLVSYELRGVTAATATTVLNESLKNLIYLSSTNPTRLLILASDEQHSQISGMIDELGRSAAVSQKTQVYPIERKRILAQSVLASLGPDLISAASIQVSPETNSLVVRASDEMHERFKEAIAAIVDQLPQTTELETKVYRLKRGTPSAALIVLTRLVPEAKIAADDKGGTLAATASDVDQERIQTVVEQMEDSESSDETTEIYRFERVSAATVQATFRTLAPEAKIGFDVTSNVVIATASEEMHKRFQEAAEKLDGIPTGAIVRVYPFEPRSIRASTIVASLDKGLKDTVSIQVNDSVNSLIVRGSEEAHANFKGAIDALIEQLPDPVDKSTRVYPLKVAAADSVQRAVAPLLTTGVAVGDTASNSLIVTALETDHERIEQVIERLDTA